jgi:GDP-L-fucose synthase
MPTNLYGPNDFFSENDSHVIPGLIHRMHSAMKNNHEEFSIWGSGEPLREFLYVEDLANAVLHTVENDIEGDLINIGSGEEISINNLGSLIKDIIGYKGKIIYDSSKPDGNPRKLLDSTLINDSGWRSSTPLKEGLSKTYDWFVNNKM